MLGPAVLLAALVTMTPSAARGDLWYEHYARAEKALQNQAWSEAIDELNHALEKKGDPGARVRTYGMKVIAYFPYLKLGVAYYHLGEHDAALQAFETEERLGAIGGSERHLGELEELRRLAREARTAAAEEERRKIRRLVEASLEEADRLEAAGQLRDAVAALGPALALDPENAEATGRIGRLRAEIARQEEQSERESRRAGLVERGRRLLEDGLYEEAASALQQALDLSPDAAVRDLLARARSGLGRQLETVQAAQRQEMIEARLAEASRLEAEGSFARALERLQPVLTLDPTNADALALQARLLKVRQEEERIASRRAAVDALLAETRRELEAGRGRVEKALAAANRVLALDPANEEALEALAAGYRQLNRSLLGSGPRQSIPPAIRFSDLRQELDDGLQAERVRSPVFRLHGVVIDDSPVTVVFRDSGGRTLDAAVQEQSVGNVFISEFSLEARLDPGPSTFQMTATDADRLSTSSAYTVLYVRPFFRALWFQALVASALLLVAGAVLFRRAARRRSLRTRRFNPYVAGAPVLDEDLFFGRQKLLDRILQTIHNNSLLLYGERRIGKTSIQHHLRRRLRDLDDPDYEFFPVYIDLQGVPEERFFGSLAGDLFEDLSEYLDGRGPTVPETGAYSYRHLVRDLQAVIRALQRRSQKRVKLVLLIDEVDELNDYDPRINQRLRSLFMKSFAEQMVAVVSGVEIRKRWEREASPWYNFFEELEVTAFRPEDARALVERPIRGVFKVDEGVVERVLDLTGCRPYRIQKLCMALVNRMHDERRHRITVADVEAVGRAAAESS